MDDPNIKTLNQILKGEHMAIHAFDDVVGKIEDTALKQELYHLQSIHKDNASKLSNHIVGLGGHPDGSTGVSGVMADSMMRVQTTLNRDPKYILGKLVEGEEKGISSAQEVIKGDVDRYSAQVIKEVLTNDRSNVDRLKALMNRY